MTTTLLRGRLQVQVLPGSPKKPIDFSTCGAAGPFGRRHPCGISREHAGNVRGAAYKARTGRSGSVAMWRPRQDCGFPRQINGLTFQLGRIRPTADQCVTGRASKWLGDFKFPAYPMKSTPCVDPFLRTDRERMVKVCSEGDA